MLVSPSPGITKATRSGNPGGRTVALVKTGEALEDHSPGLIALPWLPGARQTSSAFVRAFSRINQSELAVFLCVGCIVLVSREVHASL
jgi:hypothetical protein